MSRERISCESEVGMSVFSGWSAAARSVRLRAAPIAIAALLAPAFLAISASPALAVQGWQSPLELPTEYGSSTALKTDSGEAVLAGGGVVITKPSGGTWTTPVNVAGNTREV